MIIELILHCILKMLSRECIYKRKFPVATPWTRLNGSFFSQEL